MSGVEWNVIVGMASFVLIGFYFGFKAGYSQGWRERGKK